jgi:IclR family transcriptional regulator, pca regulon regulatory protein
MSEEEQAGSSNKEFLTTLAKGLAVVRAFNEQQKTLTVSEAADIVGISRATSRRILHTLYELGYVKQEGRNFSLTPNTLELGYKFLSTQSWIDRANGLLKELSDDVEESCSAGILQENEIVYVAHLPSHHLLSIDESVGTRLSAFHTSMGRVQLGFLDDDELWRRLNNAKIAPLTPVTDRRMKLPMFVVTLKKKPMPD